MPDEIVMIVDKPALEEKVRYWILLCSARFMCPSWLRLQGVLPFTEGSYLKYEIST
jgi:hypothetical protein